MLRRYQHLTSRCPRKSSVGYLGGTSSAVSPNRIPPLPSWTRSWQPDRGGRRSIRIWLWPIDVIGAAPSPAPWCHSMSTKIWCPPQTSSSSLPAPSDRSWLQPVSVFASTGGRFSAQPLDAPAKCSQAMARRRTLISAFTPTLSSLLSPHLLVQSRLVSRRRAWAWPLQAWALGCDAACRDGLKTSHSAEDSRWLSGLTLFADRPSRRMLLSVLLLQQRPVLERHSH